jgi:D-alanyl-D-alanine carboxypeptidase
VSEPELDELLDAVVGPVYPGAVVVAVGPDFRYERAVGAADLASGAPMTLDHQFRIASVTKLFTAAVVLRLVGAGVLALDGDAGPVITDVTVRQLLNNTAGLPDPWDSLAEWMEPYREDIAHSPGLRPEDMFALVLERPRLFAPGTDWSYGGSNYLALGLLVEQVTGVSLREHLRRLVEPLGLAVTKLAEGPERPPGLARGYLVPDNPLLPGPGPGMLDATDVDLFSWGGGGMVSNAREVCHYLEALLGGKVLEPHLRAEMLTTVPADWEESDAYGLGIEEMTSLVGIVDSPCGVAWGHLGFALGYTTIALASERGERRVVVALNGFAMSPEPWEAVGRLVWACYC